MMKSRPSGAMVACLFNFLSIPSEGGSMNRLIIWSAVLLMTAVFRAEASIEYLRFEGSISPFYNSAHDGYDPAFGLTAGQMVHFDFTIDTAQDAAGHTDSSFEDNFLAIYDEGSVTGSGDNFGQTSTFPEGITSWLVVTNTLLVGINFDRLDNTGQDLSINTWTSATSIDLMGNSYFSNNKIANLSMTYRGSTPPPAYVPPPAAIWLFGSGLLGLVGMARRKNSSQ